MKRTDRGELTYKETRKELEIMLKHKMRGCYKNIYCLYNNDYGYESTISTNLNCTCRASFNTF